MAKKDDDLIAKLVDIIERNTKAYELFAQAINNQVEADREVPGPAPTAQTSEVKTEASAPTAQTSEVKTEEKAAPKATLEKCRDIVMEMDQKGKNRDATVVFLSKFGAKNMKEVKESDYDDLYKRGKVIVDMAKKNGADKPLESLI